MRSGIEEYGRIAKYVNKMFVYLKSVPGNNFDYSIFLNQDFSKVFLSDSPETFYKKDIRIQFDRAIVLLQKYSIVSFDRESFIVNKGDNFLEVLNHDSIIDYLHYFEERKIEKNEIEKKQKDLLDSTNEVNKSSITTNTFNKFGIIATFIISLIALFNSYNPTIDTNTNKRIINLQNKYDTLIKHNFEQAKTTDSLLEYFNTQIDSLKQEIKVLKIVK